MRRSQTLTAGTWEPRAGRVARRLARVLQIIGDGRLAMALLVLAAAWNAAAAALEEGERLLQPPAYPLLLGVIVLSGVAAVAVRMPAAWREWRLPGPLPRSAGSVAEVPLDHAVGADRAAVVERVLAAAGYRTRLVKQRGGWSLSGVRRGWSRFAGLGSHLALVVLLVGTGLGAAFATESVFSLVPGQQSPLSTAAGQTAAIRLERFDARFGPDGRPTRLDTGVAMLRDGQVVDRQTIRVNSPGSFDGYLVHGWTYGPAAHIRVTTLAGRPLLDSAVALDGSIGAHPGTLVELPAVGLTMGISLGDARENSLGLVLAGADGAVDAVTLRPGQERRLGGLVVRHDGLTSYVTFLSRRDPGLPLVFGAALLLTATLAAGLWLPRRRLTVWPAPGALLVVMRAERFDRIDHELAGLKDRLSAALATSR